MRSIRTFLLSRLLGGTALVLAAAGCAVYLVVTRSLQAQFDDNLADRVQGFASILFQEKDHVEFEFSEELMPEYADEHAPDYFELRFDDGRLLERSEALHGHDLVVPSPPSTALALWSAPLPDGRDGRYVSRIIEVHHVTPEEGPNRPQAAKIAIVVARGIDELVAAERSVLAMCVAAWCALMGLIAFVAWRAVERGLEPARRLATTLDAIEVERLPQGLELGPLPRELAPVADKTDALIRRVDTALKRERRTSADIAHELRTPISEMLTISEVALGERRDPESARRALARVRDVAWRMGRAVSTLLKLARLEMGAETFDREGVDLGELVAEVLQALPAVERDLRIDQPSELGYLAEADREALRIVVSNLLSNALHYSPPDASVTCRIAASSDGWRIVVENTSTELRLEDLQALAEPFWRKDRARADRNHSGLGLALSRALAEKTGLRLAFELDHGTFRAILGGGATRERRPATTVA